MTDRTEVRSAARLLLLDSNRRVLLFLHTDGHAREFWATPGGGLEPGESIEQAARREAVEELGAGSIELRLLWTGHSEFPFANRRVSQTETFFLITSHGAILGPETREQHRREGITEVRWWTLDEIDAAEQAIYPIDLAARVRAHVREDV
jgi:8-oxo-dGTP pyrophosphatase MutT (NUDIX family)